MKVLALTHDAPLLTQLLASHVEAGLELAIEPSLEGGLKRLKQSAWSLVLIDSSLEDEIVDVVERVAATGQRAVLLARSASVELTLDAIRRGAWDMLPFPIDADELRDVLARSNATDDAMGVTGRRSGAVYFDDARGRSVGRLSPPSGVWGGDVSAPIERGALGVPLIGDSAVTVSLFRTATRVADSPTTVLIQGEKGTGKTLLARFIHERSRRRDAPFVAVNCTAIPDHLLESELFGHEKGAYAGALGRRTGRIEAANGGTLLLDEVAWMPFPLQAKVLRALQEREVERLGGTAAIPVDVRLLATTNRMLDEEVAAGHFREDLYDLLAVVVLTVPPLRERVDDIRPLAEYCVVRGARERGWQVEAIAEETVDVLRSYSWPGNVRELCNAIEHALFMADGTVLFPSHLPPEIRNRESSAPVRSGEQRQPSRYDPGSGSASLPPLEALEQDHIRRALALTGGHIGRAADLLGIHRNTLRRKLRDRGLGPNIQSGAQPLNLETDALPS